MIEIIALIVFWILAIAGVILTLFGIGGTFLVLIGALLYNLITWSFSISVGTLVVLTVLAVAGELFEWFITFAHAKRKGVSTYGIMGTLLGAIIGAIAFSVVPIIGTIVGLILGAIIGAFLFEYIHIGKAEKAWKAAKAALMGRALVALCKMVIVGIQIWLVLRII